MRSPLSALKGGGRVLRGSVSSAGAIVGGTGFSVIRTGAGAYTVTLLQPYPAPPIVGLSIANASAAPVGDPSAATVSAFTVQTFASDTRAATDFAFQFTVSEQER